MRTFWPVFFAILAAGTIFYVFLDHQKKLERWESAKRAGLARFESCVRRGERLGNPGGYDAAVSQLRQSGELIAEMKNVARQMVLVLENKPGWFEFMPASLSKEDAALLADFKGAVQDGKK